MRKRYVSLALDTGMDIAFFAALSIEDLVDYIDAIDEVLKERPPRGGLPELWPVPMNF